MLRKSLTILSLVGLVVSVGAWAASYWKLGYTHSPFSIYATKGCIGFRSWDVNHLAILNSMNSQGVRVRYTSIGNDLFMWRGRRGSPGLCPECGLSRNQP